MTNTNITILNNLQVNVLQALEVMEYDIKRNEVVTEYQATKEDDEKYLGLQLVVFATKRREVTSNNLDITRKENEIDFKFTITETKDAQNEQNEEKETKYRFAVTAHVCNNRAINWNYFSNNGYLNLENLNTSSLKAFLTLALANVQLAIDMDFIDND